MSDIIRKPVHCVIEDFKFRAFQAVFEVSSFVNIGIICFNFAQFFKFTVTKWTKFLILEKFYLVFSLNHSNFIDFSAAYFLSLS